MAFIAKIFHRYWRRMACVCGGMLVLALLSAGGIWWWMNTQVVPQSAIDAFYCSSRFYDCHGELITIKRGSDYRWLFPIPLSAVPLQMQRDVIAVEDKRFYEHHGVDYIAMLRACRQLLTSGRVLSGGSTITMQVVNQYCGRGRGIIYKLRQIGMALNWERTHTKEEILTQYFNMLPYGGKLCGIEAAAQYYYGRSASDLNRAEQLLLTGLPQGPNRFRPDLHPERAVWRRNIVLIILQRGGFISATEAEAVKAMPLRFRDFRLAPWPTQIENELTNLLVARYPGKREFETTIDLRLQNALRAHLTAGRDRLEDVHDGAGVIIENATGAVRAIVGTLPDGDPRCRMSNAALAWRSPGSALKPFIYGEALNGGLIVADTLLDDTPVAFKDYHPSNYDGEFRGKVRASEALASSLNIPALRLLKRLTVRRMLARLTPMGLFPPNAQPDEERVGLTLALGGCESQLLALAAAYSSLGEYRIAHFLQSVQDDAPGERYWLPGTRVMLLKMLRSQELPGAEGLKVAWKTGTSNGNRDAWCFSVTPQWTVAIWYGNKIGTPSPALVGGRAAAPVAGALQRYLHQNAPPQWSEDEEAQQLREQCLCSASGLAPSPLCEQTYLGECIVGIPLQQCQSCGRNIQQETQKPTVVITPTSGAYRLRANTSEVQFIINTTPSPCHLYIDGGYAGSYQNGAKLPLKSGMHQLLFWCGDGYATTKVNISVEE